MAKKQAKLLIERGFHRGQSFVLSESKTFFMGRDKSNDFSIHSSQASRVHCKIVCRRGAYGIEDLKSKNGVSVNNKKVTNRALRHNDTITVAGQSLRFVMEEKYSPAATESDKPIISPPKPIPRLRLKKSAQPGAKTEKASVVIEDALGLAGQTFADFKLLAVLAKGKRSIIYKGTQPEANRVVAVKALLPEAADDAETKQWFINGARRAGQLLHNEAVRPVGGGRAPDPKTGKGILYYATVFMEGGSAAERFHNAPKQGLPLVKSALETVVHVLRALEFGASKKTLHLGVRPSKILFDEAGHAKLNGLGFDNSPASPQALATPEQLAYTAPEQHSGGHPLSVRTDIYGLGATFWYMLTGAHPRQRTAAGPKIADKPPKKINPAVPDSLCRIVERTLAPEPQERYENYSHLLHDLRWALRGEVWPR